MNIDLGCGTEKTPGFFGIDRRNLPGVDLIFDMNYPIPLPDDSVEFVMASRSLPYVRDLFAVMADIYRMCTHKAVVCILAPFAHSFAHMSNPFFRQKFDLYTPRYFTPNFFQPPSGARCPELPGYDDHEPPFDFRLLRMELFYYPPYEPPLYNREELEMLPGLEMNVVHEIMYHFVAVKHGITNEELVRMSSQSYIEPACAANYRTSPPDSSRQL
ncbi:hypothetical protein [Paenibacillus humicola]|uniref:hypothetical protein n=1 Tax=Paenibacillus humicola TaxID=3110540 RepID=UPI00237BA895|nr:hypothetical protein [Paenibacillus humicola]